MLTDATCSRDSRLAKLCELVSVNFQLIWVLYLQKHTAYFILLHDNFFVFFIYSVLSILVFVFLFVFVYYSNLDLS